MIRTNGDDIECRIEDAVYFADGKVATLVGDLDVGYEVDKWTTLKQLEEADPDAWGTIYEINKDESNEYIAYSGETSFGGAGFISLYDKENKDYYWIVHLNNCNNYVSVEIQKEHILAICDAPYPNGTSFIIPIHQPERIHINAMQITA